MEERLAIWWLGCSSLTYKSYDPLTSFHSSAVKSGKFPFANFLMVSLCLPKSVRDDCQYRTRNRPRRAERTDWIGELLKIVDHDSQLRSTSSYSISERQLTHPARISTDCSAADLASGVSNSGSTHSMS
jgi:hypothetical protein